MANVNVVPDDRPLRGLKELTVNGVRVPISGGVVSDLYDFCRSTEGKIVLRYWESYTVTAVFCRRREKFLIRKVS